MELVSVTNARCDNLGDMDLQIDRERTMIERGQLRAQNNLAKTLERGAADETVAGIVLAKKAVAPMAKAIEEFVATANAGRGGRRNTAALLLVGVDPTLAAFITLKVMLTCAIGGRSVKTAAMNITDRLADELAAETFEQNEEAIYRSIVRNAVARGQAGSRIAKAVQKGIQKFAPDQRPRWTTPERIHLGTKLVELAEEHLGIFKTYGGYDLKRKRHHLSLRFVYDVEDWFKRYNAAAGLTRPLSLPCVAPPKPWEAVHGGAYYSEMGERIAIVKKSFPGQLAALQKADLSAVYGGVNALQNTPWRINKRVLEVMYQAWDRDAGLTCLPKRESEPVPTMPDDIVALAKDDPIRKNWRRETKAIHEANAASMSGRLEFARCLDIATDNADLPAIYFPHHLDFRGRAYASSTSLNPQGADHARGLLEFANGKVLGERGAYWLAVHGANLFGYDKVSFDDRYQWAMAHIYNADAVAQDPLTNLWWTEADKPWCFLAWCFEWAQCGRGHGIELISHLPVALDGSCNGIQHFSAMLRDPVGGAAVNLVPSEKPQDIYQAVADRATELLKLAAKVEDENQWLAEGWLAFGLDRKITKRAVMVLPYGGTFKSCMDYITEAVKDKIKEGKENPFGDQLPKATGFLAIKVWAAIGDTVIAARAAMGWLQQCTRVANEAKCPIHWTTPTGFVAFQDYRECKSNRIKTRFHGSLVYFGSPEAGEKLDGNKQVSAVSPNFVHSLDASAMMLTLNKCVENGITDFAMIHDSYGTHAAATDVLADILRIMFVLMYSNNDVLTQFRDELAAQLPEEFAAKLPPVPDKGSLDLTTVLGSKYFFA